MTKTPRCEACAALEMGELCNNCFEEHMKTIAGRGAPAPVTTATKKKDALDLHVSEGKDKDVVMSFITDLSWFALTPDGARELARELARLADKVEGKK